MIMIVICDYHSNFSLSNFQAFIKYFFLYLVNFFKLLRMSKHVISKNSQVTHKEQKFVHEETGLVAPLKVIWGCLVSSLGTIELYKGSHVLGSGESKEDVCIMNLSSFFLGYVINKEKIHEFYD